MELLIRDVRCFAGLHKIPIRPLTILVGENSTGKSTVLASLAVVSNTSGFPFRPKFNDPPYSLGTYETIARWGPRLRDRSSSFSLGFTRDNPESEHSEVSATYTREKGQPVLSEYKFTQPTMSFRVERMKSTLSGEIFIAAKDDQPEFRRLFEVPLPFGEMSELTYVLFWIVTHMQRKEESPNEAPGVIGMDRAFEIVHAARFSTRTCLSIAPIRTKPRRTYDQVKEEYAPEGDHVPVILANALPLASENTQFAQLKEAIEQFGQDSDLFSQVTVRPLGKTPAGPFQLLIKDAGGRFNLSDVGYGVSQVLPVIVQSVLGGREARMLLQQPEVHLHPKAQAALGTFFVRLVKELKAEFVIETHSDYIIDRVRREVAEGRIPPSDVVLLYFSKKKSKAKYYPIEIDQLGNIKGAPREYRHFFLEEEMRLLMRSEK
jgi:hypothetical protein